jgi:hypothetical protein
MRYSEIGSQAMQGLVVAKAFDPFFTHETRIGPRAEAIAKVCIADIIADAAALGSRAWCI